jgi:hypothetical protein
MTSHRRREEDEEARPRRPVFVVLVSHPVRSTVWPQFGNRVHCTRNGVCQNVPMNASPASVQAMPDVRSASISPNTALSITDGRSTKVKGDVFADSHPRNGSLQLVRRATGGPKKHKSDWGQSLRPPLRVQECTLTAAIIAGPDRRVAPMAVALVTWVEVLSPVWEPRKVLLEPVVLGFPVEQNVPMAPAQKPNAVLLLPEVLSCSAWKPLAVLLLPPVLCPLTCNALKPVAVL